VDRKALDGSNAVTVPRLGFPHMHRRITNKDAKNARHGRFRVVSGSIQATTTKIVETATTMVRMIAHDVKLAKRECAQFLADSSTV
jgi:hypothetical protein